MHRRQNLPVGDASGYCNLIRDTLLLEKNVMLMRNFAGSVRGSKGRTYTHTSRLPNVDIWLVGDMELTAGRYVAGSSPMCCGNGGWGEAEKRR